MNKNISEERHILLKRLAKKMNSQSSYPLPITKHLITCFDIAINQTEAEFLDKVDTCFYSYSELLNLSSLTKKQFDTFLKNILRKGLINYVENKQSDNNYVLSPIIVGWFEVYLAGGEETEDRKLFAEAFEKYSNSRLFLNHFPIRNVLNLWFKRKLKPYARVAQTGKISTKENRIISVNKNINAGNHGIFSTNSIYELINNLPDDNEVVAVYCFCRQWKKMVKQPCQFNHYGESCIIIGRAAKTALKAGLGRIVSKKEAFDIIQDTSEKGAVHQVFHEYMDIEKPEIAICNCCWDCCGVIGSYNRGLGPLCTKAYYIAGITYPDKCVGCGKCIKFCPVNAIKPVDASVSIDRGKCIGCGQCQLQCPQEVFELTTLERNVYLPIQKKSEARLFQR